MEHKEQVDEQLERRKAALKKYQDLKARADHPNTPQAEKDVAYRMAAKVMADWEIDELELVAASGATPAIVMSMIRLTDVGGVLQDALVGMAASISRGFECRNLIHEYNYPSADRETGNSRIPGVYLEVVGYSHDVAMAKELYYTTAMDLQVGLMGEKQKAKNYQREYSKGYVERIVDRIMAEVVFARKKRVQEGVSSGVALALRDQKQLVADFFADLHKGEKFGSYREKKTGYDANARARGRDRASKADLGGAGRIAGNGMKPSLGGERKGLGK